MRGLRSTIALLVVLIGLGAYIYFVTWKQPEGGNDAASKQEKVFDKVEADKIEELKVTSEKGDTTTLRKTGGTWQVAQPIAVTADEGTVSSIASALSQLSMVRVVDENPLNLKEYGLEPPRVAVEFKASGDKDYRKLFIGEKSPTGADVFARRNDDKRVFLVAAYQEPSFNKGTFDLRDKTVIKFDRDKIDSVDVTGPAHAVAIAKEGGDWKLTRPVQVKADFGSVEGLIGRLQSVQMKSIVTNDPTPADLKKFGLDKPQATVNLNAGSARATLLLGAKAGEDTNTVYARDASKPVVMTVESALVDDLNKPADEYRRKDLFEFRAFNANRVEFTRDSQTVAFEKVKGQGENAEEKWRRVSPTAGDVDRDKIESLLSRVSNMRAASFVESAAKTGLDKPALAVSVKFDENKKSERVVFGKTGDDVYASRAGEAGAAKADATDFNEVIKSLDELAK